MASMQWHQHQSKKTSYFALCKKDPEACYAEKKDFPSFFLSVTTG